MGRFFANLAQFVQLSTIFIGLVAFIALHPETTRLIAQKALLDNGIVYKNIHGTLLSGFTLEQVRYQKAFRAKRIFLHYNLFDLLSSHPTIDRLRVVAPRIYPEKFPHSQTGESNASTTFYLPPITLRRAVVTNGTLVLSDPIGFDADGSDLTYDFDTGDLTVKRFGVKIATIWADAKLQGRYAQKTLTARGHLVPLSKIRQEIEKSFEAPPRSLPISVRWRGDDVRLQSHLAHLKPKETNLTLTSLALKADYHVKENYADGNLSYHLALPDVDANIVQHVVFTPTLAYATTLRARLKPRDITLPADRLLLRAAGDRDVFTADGRLGPYMLTLYSTDYETFAATIEATPHRPYYLRHLSPFFTHQTIRLHGDLLVEIEPSLSLKGDLRLDGNYSETTAYVEYIHDALLVKGRLVPLDPNAGIWKDLPPIFKEKVHAYLYYSPDNKLLNLSSTNAYLTVFERDNLVKGWANIGSLTLDTHGRIEPNGSVFLDFHTHIDSLHQTLQEFGLSELKPFLDAELDDTIHVEVTDRFSLGYHLDIPWYLVQTDSQHIYYGLHSTVDGTYADHRLDISRYDVGFMGRRIASERPSIITYDDNGTIELEHVAILDRGTLRGRYDIPDRNGTFTFEARAMHVVQPEVNATLDAKIHTTLTQSSVDTEGEVKILDATVTYMPQKSYTVNDEDIVIIQDIKEPSHTKKSVNLHLYSDRPLHYRVPIVDATFEPDITLWKEAGKPLGILGIVRILGGRIDVEKKHFEIEPSEIYFAGAYPINPYLDLKLRYDYDFKRFYIYVSHTLSDPVFLFSSEPPMSQNDIMSYILFGTPAQESFAQERDQNIATMLLGLGLKNAIGSATGLVFDTFNILQNPEGGFGVEIGKRFGRLRILYRNDSLSSFIIQYTLSRSMRLDLEVREMGQGVNLLYIKDFKGPKGLIGG